MGFRSGAHPKSTHTQKNKVSQLKMIKTSPKFSFWVARKRSDQIFNCDRWGSAQNLVNQFFWSVPILSEKLTPTCSSHQTPPYVCTYICAPFFCGEAFSFSLSPFLFEANIPFAQTPKSLTRGGGLPTFCLGGRCQGYRFRPLTHCQCKRWKLFSSLRELRQKYSLSIVSVLLTKWQRLTSTSIPRQFWQLALTEKGC